MRYSRYWPNASRSSTSSIRGSRNWPAKSLLQAPVVSGRRFLLSALRIVPELEPGRGQGRCPGCSRPLVGVHCRVSSRPTVPAC